VSQFYFAYTPMYLQYGNGVCKIMENVGKFLLFLGEKCSIVFEDIQFG